MKRRIVIILTCIAIITMFSYIKTIRANRPYYPEPKRKNGIPDHIKWNSDTGEYYNSKDFIWDPEKNSYFDKSLVNTESSQEIIIPNPTVEWISNHTESKDKLDQAILKYFSAPPDPMVIQSSVWSPSKDKNLKYITDMGIGYIPQMLKKIKDSEGISTTLKGAIIVMTKTYIPNTDGSKEGMDRWVDGFIYKVKYSNSIIENASTNLRDIKIREKAKKDIIELGIFGLPYAREMEKKGDKHLINIYKERYGDSFISTNEYEILDLIDKITNEL